MAGRPPRNQGAPVELRVASHPANLAKVRHAVTEFASALGFCEADVDKLVLAIDEAMANVIKHGYDRQPDQPIDVRLEPVAESGRVGMRTVIRDYGKTVDPDSICGRDLDDVRPGGLGVHIMRTVMDEVNYARAEGAGTRLTMLKWIRHE
jgi:anti-sigma regulatory factor (Ser/Thr protein kinase)